ncbi:MAG: ABC transporter substrate-binding protein [Chloroflexota bacterium]
MNRAHHSTFGLLSALTLLGAGLAGCGSSARASRNVLRLPLYANRGRVVPGILDPARATSATPLLLTSLLHAGLVKFSTDLHVIPELAVSIPTITASGKTYTFTIRQDARFADGRPCAATDVAYSFARALSPALHSNAARRYLGDIQGAAAVENGSTAVLRGVRALDRLTVRIRLTRPDAGFLDRLAFPAADIVEPQTPANRPGGMGPWAVSGITSGGGLILRRRRHYFGGPLQVHELQLIPVASIKSAMDMYRKGTLDAVEIPFSEVASLDSNPDFHQSTSLDAYYALPPRGGGSLLAASLDRIRLVRKLPALSALTSIVPGTLPDYVSSSPVVSPVPSRKLAVRMEIPSHRTSALDALKASIAKQWRESRSGIPVRLIHRYFSLPDPGRWLSLVLPQTTGTWMGRVLAQANRLTNDPVTRMSMYSKGENWAISKGLIIPLASGTVSYLIKPAVSNLQATPAGLMPENDNWVTVGMN